MLSCRADLFKHLNPKQLFRGIIRLRRVMLDVGPAWVVEPPSFTAPPSIIKIVKEVFIEVGFDDMGRFTMDGSMCDADLYTMIIETLNRRGLEADEDENKLNDRKMEINYKVMYDFLPKRSV